jgi:hypothetical protein
MMMMTMMVVMEPVLIDGIQMAIRLGFCFVHREFLSCLLSCAARARVRENNYELIAD